MRDGVRYPLVDGIPSFIIPGPEPAALPGCALSLVIPALNEAESLDRVLPELKQALVALGPTNELIVVDGGSRDGTQEIVRKHGARLVSQTLPGPASRRLAASTSLRSTRMGRTTPRSSRTCGRPVARATS